MSKTYRLEPVATIEAEVARQRQAAIEAVRGLQSKCSHDAVIANGRRRICAACGIEEAYGYSWPGPTMEGGFYEFMRPAGEKPLLDTEFVKQGDVTAHRVRI